MRYCFNCSRVTVGEAQFCNFCGRTYDIKLCPRLHSNMREAEVCSACGSRDLTTPQPKLAFWLRPFLFLLSLIPGISLLVFSALFLVAYIYVFFFEPALQLRFMLMSLVLSLLWLLYIMLPSFLEMRIRRSMRKTIKK